MRACGVRAVIARLSAARVTEQRVLPRAFATTSFLCIPASCRTFRPSITRYRSSCTRRVTDRSLEALRAPAARRGEDGGRTKCAHRLELLILNVQVIGIARRIRHDRNTHPQAVNARGTLIKEIEVCDE